MAYGALVSGILGGLSGAGDDAERRMKLADETAAQDASMQRRLMMELDMKDQYAQRVAERQHAYQMQVGQAVNSAYQNERNAADADTINSQNGSEISASDLATANNGQPLTAQQRKAYGLLDQSRPDMLARKADIAESLGASDQAKMLRDQQTIEVNTMKADALQRKADAMQDKVLSDIDKQGKTPTEIQIYKQWKLDNKDKPASELTFDKFWEARNKRMGADTALWAHAIQGAKDPLNGEVDMDKATQIYERMKNYGANSQPNANDNPSKVKVFNPKTGKFD